MAGLAVTALASGVGVAATAVDDAEASPVEDRSPSTVTTSAQVPRDTESGVSRGSARPTLDGGGLVYDRPGPQVGPDRAVRPSEQMLEPDAGPREIARTMLPEYGWDSVQYACLDQLWISESNWDHTATNPTSGAYGIPQSLPAGKMASAGPDWRTNPATQIEWGLEYIRLSYGTPCSANSFKIANNWY